MEKVGVSDKKTVITVLNEGKKLANELKRKLHPTTSRETCDFLLENILSSYENALTLLALIGNGGSPQIPAGKPFEPPSPVEGSPRSEGSDQNSNDQFKSSKKRKTLPRWSEHVRVCSGAGSEAQLDDGYNWRKYGQKDILGANHPRAYYRCTHRNTQGCLATKQVQRADEDPTILEVIYIGKHSCRQERLKQSKERKEEESLRYTQHITTVSHDYESAPVKTENQVVGSKNQDPNLSSFSFPSAPVYENVEPQFFSTTYSPSFISPATSDSYFSLSPCPMNDFGIDHSLQCSDSDFAEIISNPTQILDFPLLDLDLSSFDPCFLDGSDYL